MKGCRTSMCKECTECRFLNSWIVIIRNSYYSRCTYSTYMHTLWHFQRSNHDSRTYSDDSHVPSFVGVPNVDEFDLVPVSAADAVQVEVDLVPVVVLEPVVAALT